LQQIKRIMKKLVIYHLCLFLITCAKPPVKVEEARAMETRSYPADQTELMKASLMVMQDMYYTIDNVDNDLGLITATKVTEGFQAQTRKEPDAVDTPLWKKILTAVFVVAILGTLLFLISGGGSSSKQSDDDDHHHNRGYVYHDSNNGDTVYRYKITLTINEDDVLGSTIRVSAQGEKLKGDNIVSTGPVHEPEFFETFYSGIDKEVYN